jgi:predicted ribosomally synthesized peptide with nif11-like leader
MSIENAKVFYEKVKTDQDLQQKIGELAKAKPAETESIIIKVAGEKGFEFTLEEMRTVMKGLAAVAPKSGELTDNELESVAGGAKGTWIALSIISIGVACAASAGFREMGGCNLDQ